MAEPHEFGSGIEKSLQCPSCGDILLGSREFLIAVIAEAMLIFVGKVGSVGSIGPVWVDRDNNPHLGCDLDPKLTARTVHSQEQPEPQLPRRAAEGKTFAEVAPAWLASRKAFLRPPTVRTYQEFLVPLLEFFGTKTLAEITSSGDLVREYQDLRLHSAGAERINHETGILVQVLKRHKMWSRLADDYQRLPQRESEIGRALEPGERKRLFEMAASRPEWEVAYQAGLIAGNTTASGRELKAVRLKDVDVTNAVLHIRFGKNRFRVRDVPLNAIALPAVQRLVEIAKSKGSSEPEHYLLPYRVSGNAYDPTRPMVSFRWAWRRFTRAVGLRGLRFHDMRHDAITVLGEKNTPQDVKKSMAGHVSDRMSSHYSHPSFRAKKRAAKALETRWKQDMGKSA